jgi:hypothetical protein
VDKVAVVDDEMVFTPGAGWNWSSWSGSAPLKTRRQTAPAAGKTILVEPDLIEFAKELIGRPYVANGFDATPGVVTSASISVEGATLSRLVRVDGSLAAVVTTRGRFNVTVVPSFSSLPAPDPAPAKSGTFAIRAKQSMHVTMD